MNSKKIAAIYREIEGLSPDCATLPLPRRFGLDPLNRLNEEIMGPALGFFKDLAKREASTTDLAMEYSKRPDLQSYFMSRGMDLSSLRMMHIRARHHYTKAPIFSVAPGLKNLLEDTGIKDNVPAKFLAAPFNTCYLEFDPAEDRRVLAMSKVGPLDLIEGCFIQEKRLERLPSVSRNAREMLELDPLAPVRVLDIAFSSSPINSSDIRVNNSPAGDKLDYIQLLIQDESEPVNDLLERAIKFATSRSDGLGALNPQAKEAFANSLRENLSRLAKVLFYMHVDRKAQVSQTPTKDLEERLQAVGEKKKAKIERMLNRTYDRIVVGPMEYTPLADRIKQGSALPGKRAPHYRSGYFGIRWKGTGQAKVPDLVRVKEAIINEHLLSDRPEREYEIR